MYNKTAHVKSEWRDARARSLYTAIACNHECLQVLTAIWIEYFHFIINLLVLIRKSKYCQTQDTPNAWLAQLLQTWNDKLSNLPYCCPDYSSLQGNPALLVPFVQAEDHEQEDRLAPRDKEGTKRTESGSKEDLSDGEEGLGTADNQGGAKTQRTAIYDPFKR